MTQPAAAPVAFWLYYFNVADVGAAAERVRAERGTILERQSCEYFSGRQVI